MNGRLIKSRLRTGKRVYGTLVVSPSPHWLKMVEGLGLDFVFIDTEHIPLERQTLAWMCQGYAALGLAPVVRIPSPDPYEASMVLDGGAAGIIAPYIESADQARELVGAVKYKPLKGERLKQALADPDSLEPELRSYVEKTSEDRLLIVNIESQPAIQNLDAILDVDGVDAVLIGPHDLSCSLGVPENYEDPRFLKAVDTIITRARSRERGAGIHAFTPVHARHQEHWIQQGANLIVYSADIIGASHNLGQAIRGMRKTFGDDQESSDTDDINI